MTIKRIGIDLDEVLADFVPSYINFHNLNFGTKIELASFTSFDLSEVYKTSREEVEIRVRKFYKSEEFHNLKPVRGAITAVKKLSKKFELFIITSRPEIVSESTLYWIKKHFTKQFKKIHFAFNPYLKSSYLKKKSDIAKLLNVDLFIEDNLDFATSVAKSGIKVLLFNRLWNQAKSLHPNITRVSSWKDILERLNG